jgi:hypothetical protein
MEAKRKVAEIKQSGKDVNDLSFNLQAMHAEQGALLQAEVHSPASNNTDSPLQDWTAISSNSISEIHEVTTMDCKSSGMDNSMTVNTVMLLPSERDPVMMQRQVLSDVLATVAGMAIKNLLSPNIMQDNGFFVSFAMCKDFFKSEIGKRFVTEEVDNIFIFGRNDIRGLPRLQNHANTFMENHKVEEIELHATLPSEKIMRQNDNENLV